MRDVVLRARFLLCIGDLRVPRHRRRQGGRHVASADWTPELQVLRDGRESWYDVRPSDAADWERNQDARMKLITKAQWALYMAESFLLNSYLEAES